MKKSKIKDWFKVKSYAEALIELAKENDND